MSTTTTVLCPLGCGRQVAAEQDEIHYCVTTIRFGRKKVATNREYIGTWNGEALFYGACHDEVERQLRPYREEQIAAAGACWEEAGAPTQADPWGYEDCSCAICGTNQFCYDDGEAYICVDRAACQARIDAATPVEPPPSVFDPVPRLRPVAPTASRLIPCSDIDLTDPVVVARLAALSPSDLEWQAAVYAAYRSLGSQHVTTAETLADFRRAIAVQRSGAVAQSEDAVSHVIFELALTDIPALIEFLRGHTDQQRERVAWRYAAWLRREHGICREPAFLRRCWDVLLVGASASGMGETDRQAAAMARDNAAVRG